MISRSLNKGFSFGLTSGVITTLGLIVGLEAGTNSKLAVIGGIITIAVADAFSDAFGVHVSEEAQNNIIHKEVWKSTIYTFLAKFFFAFTFLAPILLFDLSTAVWISVFWGFSLISVFSYYIGKGQKRNPFFAVFEHLTIGAAVVTATHFLGKWVKMMYNSTPGVN